MDNWRIWSVDSTIVSIIGADSSSSSISISMTWNYLLAHHDLDQIFHHSENTNSWPFYPAFSFCKASKTAPTRSCCWFGVRCLCCGNNRCHFGETLRVVLEEVPLSRRTFFLSIFLVKSIISVKIVTMCSFNYAFTAFFNPLKKISLRWFSFALRSGPTYNSNLSQ